MLARVKSLLKLRQYQEQLKARIESAEYFSDSRDEGFIKKLPKSSSLKTVLIVDDDDKDVKLYQHSLLEEGYRVLVAKNGHEALSILKQQIVDLVLLDLILPDINGHEVCAEMRKEHRDRTIQIVIITCVEDIETKVKSLEIGADEFLVKPIDCREVRSRIRVLLKKRDYLNHLYECNQRALGLAIVDPLTGLFNQTYFKHYLELEVERTVESGHLLGLMIIDLDDFKKYNDYLGHPAGDFILKSVARVIKDNVRDLDFCARYGGEEFVVVFPNIDIEEASRIAEQTRIAISQMLFDNVEHVDYERITASLGLSFCPLSAKNTEELIEVADKLLYQAKRDGKNRLYISKES